MAAAKAFSSTTGIRSVMLTLFFLSLFCWHFLHSTQYLDNDLGWHLRAGQEMWQEKALPGPEHYNYPIAGEEWVNHEWLLDLFSFIVFDAFGYSGLAAVFSLVNVSVFVLLFFFIKRFVSKKHWIQIIAMLLLLFGFEAMKPHFGIKMQVFSLLFLTLQMTILALFAYERNKRALWWLVPLFFVWACAHGSFLIGLFLLYAWVAVTLAGMWLKKNPRFNTLFEFRDYKKQDIVRFLLISLVCTGVTFCTPYGLHLYDLLLEYSDTYYMTHILEWLPAWYYPIDGQQLFFMSSAVAIVMILAGVITGYIPGPDRLKQTKIDPWQLFLFLLFLVMALKSKRHFPLLVIVALPLVLVFFRALVPETEPDHKAKDRNIVHRIGMGLLAVIFLLTGARHMTLADYIHDPFDGNDYCYDYPCAAIEYLRESEYAGLRLVNAYGWGGYLVKSWPEKQIFIDGRQPQRQVNGKSFLEEFNRFFDEEEVGTMLAHYRTEAVLTRKEKPPRFSWLEKTFMNMEKKTENIKGNTFLKHLAASEEWEMVYEDDISAIFVLKQAIE